MGLVTWVVVLMTPVWPLTLKPQQKTSLDIFTAHVLELFPADTERQLVADPTRTGDDWSVVLPSPSCPSLLPPQHHKEPSDNTAHVWFNPADTFVASDARGLSSRVSPNSAMTTPGLTIVTLTRSASNAKHRKKNIVFLRVGTLASFTRRANKPSLLGMLFRRVGGEISLTYKMYVKENQPVKLRPTDLGNRRSGVAADEVREFVGR